MKDLPADRNEYLSGMFWIAVSAAAFYWLGSRATTLSILLEAMTIVLVITVVFVFSKHLVVPTVAPLTDQGGSPLTPAPRDRWEEQIQQLDFHHLGDFDVTMLAQTKTRLRVYVDRNRTCAAVLMDMKSADDKTALLEFCTNLEPSGSITTTTSPHPNILAHPPDET